jgi:N-glycosylase/DNA lyase
MENKFVQTPQLTHEQQIERLQRLCSDLQKALDVSEEQRRILRDMSRSAAELAESLESSRPPDRD